MFALPSRPATPAGQTVVEDATVHDASQEEAEALTPGSASAELATLSS
jgi:hypothetical protein